MTTKQILSAGLLAVGAAGMILLTGCSACAKPAATTEVAITELPGETDIVIESTPRETVVVQRAPSSNVYDCAYYDRFEENGIAYLRGEMAFPTGIRGTSALLVQKIVPEEVLVGQQFEFMIRVQNLTDCVLRDVTVKDYIYGNHDMVSATPEPTSFINGEVSWDLGELDAKETKVLRVLGAAREEGTVRVCTTATYIPVICREVRVVKADLELIKEAPAEVLICDSIPITLTVRNTGSSALTEVQVVDSLPEGWSTSEGTSFNVGTLAPGEERILRLVARANRTGDFLNTARATSAQGVQAEDSANTRVRQPVLAIACDSPDERFVGRPITVCYMVKNTGDAPSVSTVVSVPIPGGASYRGATADGSDSGGRIVWNIPSLAPGEEKELCATLVGTQIGDLNLTATASGVCAEPVSVTCTTRVSGIPAILLEVIDIDDPIEVGTEETYVITVTNQGSAPDTNIRVTCELEDSQEFVRGEGTSLVSGSGQSVTMAPVPSLAPKAKATWRVTVKAVKEDNVRFKVVMISDQLTRPVEETESTNQY